MPLWRRAPHCAVPCCGGGTRQLSRPTLARCGSWRRSTTAAPCWRLHWLHGAWLPSVPKPWQPWSSSGSSAWWQRRGMRGGWPARRQCCAVVWMPPHTCTAKTRCSSKRSGRGGSVWRTAARWTCLRSTPPCRRQLRCSGGACCAAAWARGGTTCTPACCRGRRPCSCACLSR